MFSSVLVANRGEIAVRIARTLRRLGIEAVAVYSDADAGGEHVRAADRALRIGPAAPSESYLDVDAVVDAALAAGAEAVHPGYGFLSERPELARACAAAGLAFVGPGPEAIALLGDKVAAKRAAEEAGVPILPGLQGELLSDDDIVAWAVANEPPFMVKAAAGGGGRGMRVVRDRGELHEALGAARREAQGAFGDDRLLIERYVERSRHIEVQLIADAHGNAIHLGERECSLQRRHQKVVEEAPSPVVDAELRERMGAAAVALAAASGYVNAGTVELIAEREDPGSFFFLEMNARLQVEHPVTEAVTGLDLVELQLRVAAGEPLPISQAEVAMCGHAIEARVYAEEPARGFLPATGRVVAYREPAGARVDSGVAAGSVVGSDYDAMLAKVTVHAADRAAALAGLERALGELVLLGPGTNVAYLQALLARPEVRAGELDTGLLERLGTAISPPPADPALPAVALALLLPADPGDPWAADAWRPSGPGWVSATLAGPDGELDVAIRREPDRGAGFHRWRTDAGEGTFELDGDLLTIEGVSRRLEIEREPAPTPATTVAAISFPMGRKSLPLWLRDGAGEPLRFELADEQREAAHSAASGSLEAPMPGTVIEVRCAVGDAVEEGDVLIVIESMKMELAIQSPAAGVVAEVRATAGERVGRGEALVILGAGEGEE